jgi:hypothetical protein
VIADQGVRNYIAVELVIAADSHIKMSTAPSMQSKYMAINSSSTACRQHDLQITYHMPCGCLPSTGLLHTLHVMKVTVLYTGKAHASR